MKVKVCTKVNEHSNIHYYKEFEIVDSKQEGRWERIRIDVENNAEAFKYDYYLNEDNNGIAIKQDYSEDGNDYDAAIKAIAVALQLKDDDAKEKYDYILEWENENTLTQNTARNGRPVMWYLDGDGYEAAVYIDTLETLTQEEIEKELM